MRFATVAAWLAWQQAAHPGRDRSWPRAGRRGLAQARHATSRDRADRRRHERQGLGHRLPRRDPDGGRLRDGPVHVAAPACATTSASACTGARWPTRPCSRHSPRSTRRAATSRSPSSSGTRSRRFVVFARARVDVAVLEVGMGGRLDAVNMLDADAAAVVSVGLDHREWLGDTVEAIGAEKAGIFRAGRPAIFGGRQMPRSVARARRGDRRAPPADRHGLRLRRARGRLGLRRLRLAAARTAVAGARRARASSATPQSRSPCSRRRSRSSSCRTRRCARASPAVRLPGRFQVVAGRAGMDPGRRPQHRGRAIAGREPRSASMRAGARSRSAGSSATRTSRRSSPRSRRRSAAGSPSGSRARGRLPPAELARRIARGRRGVGARRRRRGGGHGRRRGSNASPATGSSCSARS